MVLKNARSGYTAKAQIWKSTTRNDIENIKVLTSPLFARPFLREPPRILHTSDMASFRDPDKKLII